MSTLFAVYGLGFFNTPLGQNTLDLKISRYLLFIIAGIIVLMPAFFISKTIPRALGYVAEIEESGAYAGS
jgi:hypothetical protein